MSSLEEADECYRCNSKKVTARPDGVRRGGFLVEKHDNGDITADFPPLGEVKVSEWEWSKNVDY